MFDPTIVSLIGPMGAGKSSIGTRLAKCLDVGFVDLDAAIVAKAGKSIPRIFDEDGQCVFRALEGECLQYHVDQAKPCVLATGGGVVMRAPNRLRLGQAGPVIWLDARPNILAQRIAGDRNRPLLNGVNPLQKAQELDLQRRSYYRRCANFHINTGEQRINAVIAAILVFLNHDG